MEITISPEIEASIISLAGKWAYKDMEDDPKLFVDINLWSKDFNNRFTAFYIVLFRAILEARNENKKKTIIHNRLSRKKLTS